MKNVKRPKTRGARRCVRQASSSPVFSRDHYRDEYKEVRTRWVSWSSGCGASCTEVAEGGLLVGVVGSWRFSGLVVGQILLGAGSPSGGAVCPLVLGPISDVADLSPGWEGVQVEEADAPRIDGHCHDHQANDIDPQASFHLRDTDRHTLVTEWAVARNPECPPPVPAQALPCHDHPLA